jgi:hypothetical protein
LISLNPNVNVGLATRRLTIMHFPHSTLLTTIQTSANLHRHQINDAQSRAIRLGLALSGIRWAWRLHFLRGVHILSYQTSYAVDEEVARVPDRAEVRDLDRNELHELRTLSQIGFQKEIILESLRRGW